jgi:hypothetical protein
LHEDHAQITAVVFGQQFNVSNFAARGFRDAHRFNGNRRAFRGGVSEPLHEAGDRVDRSQRCDVLRRKIEIQFDRHENSREKRTSPPRKMPRAQDLPA